MYVLKLTLFHLPPTARDGRFNGNDVINNGAVSKKPFEKIMHKKAPKTQQNQAVFKEIFFVFRGLFCAN